MTDTALRLRPVTLLAQDAQRYGAGILGASLRTSLPIPLGGAGGAARYAFLLSHVEVVQPGQPPSLFPPRYVLTLAARDGLVLLIRRVNPAEFGRDDDEDTPLGLERAPGERLSDAHLTNLARVYQALDRIAPAFFGLATPSEDERRTFVASYLGAIEAATEPALAPYVHAIGREFAEWVGRT